MPERGPRLRAVLLLAMVAGLVAAAFAPGIAFAASGRAATAEHVTIADAPGSQGEDCVNDPNAKPGVGLRTCDTPFSLATLIPFVGAGILVLLAIAVGWYLVMRRRLSRPFIPDDALASSGSGSGAAGAASGAAASAGAGAWWTCESCGSTNMTGSARCYKCGAWQR